MLVENVSLKYGTGSYQRFIVNAFFRVKTLKSYTDVDKKVLILFLSIDTDFANDRYVRHRGNYYHFTSTYKTTIYLDLETYERVVHNHSGFFEHFNLMNESGSNISSQRMEENFKTWLVEESGDIIDNEVINGALKEFYDSKITELEEQKTELTNKAKEVELKIFNMQKAAQAKGILPKSNVDDLSLPVDISPLSDERLC